MAPLSPYTSGAYVFGSILHARNAPRSSAVVFPILMLFFLKVAHCDYAGLIFFVFQNFVPFSRSIFFRRPLPDPFWGHKWPKKNFFLFGSYWSETYQKKFSGDSGEKILTPPKILTKFFLGGVTGGQNFFFPFLFVLV